MYVARSSTTLFHVLIQVATGIEVSGQLVLVIARRKVRQCLSATFFFEAMDVTRHGAPQPENPTPVQLGFLGLAGGMNLLVEFEDSTLKVVKSSLVSLSFLLKARLSLQGLS